MQNLGHPHRLHRARLALGKPYIESFNGRLRDECLNTEDFADLLEAQVVLEDWRIEYNTYRPHQSLAGLTPAAYADHWTQQHQPTHPQRLDSQPGPPQPASDMRERTMKETLAEVAGYQCWACGFAPRDMNGAIVESIEHFHLDHIEPKSEGGSNYLHNRALLCAPCNGSKSNKRIPLKTLRDDMAVRLRRESYGHIDYPVDIDQVQTEAMLRWLQWRAEQGLDIPLPF